MKQAQENPTICTYNARDQLRTVTQIDTTNYGSGVVKTQVRTFTYDSLGRLKTAVNPESGTNSYEYELDGLLKKKTDGRGASATMSYDGARRLTGKTYSDGIAAVKFCYDGEVYDALSGEKLWSALGRRDNGEALQNAFVNITDKLGSITLEGGGTALSQVSGLTDMKADRLYANVSSGLAGALAGSSAFTSVSAGDHAPYNAISYKNVADARGNIQFSFNESRRGADIDIDLGNMASRNPMGPLIHVGEVLQNKITNTTTSQDAVRKILMANPGVMITPSPDPKWNRK